MITDPDREAVEAIRHETGELELAVDSGAHPAAPKMVAPATNCVIIGVEAYRE
jgi:hypothetical protein